MTTKPSSFGKKSPDLPSERVVRMGADSNFWTMGPTGPCGPCSEIYVDLTPEKGETKNFEEDAESGRYLEIWNLVFTQFDKQEDGTLKPLPKPNIDTGMGLERVASVMQKVSTNFQTDLIKPLIDASQKLLKSRGVGLEGTDQFKFNVIADHLRASTFLITDGVLPSNEGRGYVLRRILRRAIRNGKLLGFKEPFVYQLTSAVVQLMGEIYPELVQRQTHVSNVIKAEEERFFETLEQGEQRLEELMNSMTRSKKSVDSAVAGGEGFINPKEIGAGQTLPGKEAFVLYDTYGFPLELTKEILKTYGFSVDEESFKKEMEAQRERARAGWKGSGDAVLPQLYKELESKIPATIFKGYDKMKDLGQVVQIVRVKDKKHEPVQTLNEGEYGFIILNQTPFYAEKGGQVGDKGNLQGFNSAEVSWADVLDTQMVTDTLIGHWSFQKTGKIVGGPKGGSHRGRKRTPGHHAQPHGYPFASRRPPAGFGDPCGAGRKLCGAGPAAV